MFIVLVREIKGQRILLNINLFKSQRRSDYFKFCQKKKVRNLFRQRSKTVFEFDRQGIDALS